MSCFKIWNGYEFLMISEWLGFVIFLGLSIRSNVDLEVTILLPRFMTVNIMGRSKHQIRGDQYTTPFTNFGLYYKRGGYYGFMKELFKVVFRNRIQFFIIYMSFIFIFCPFGLLLPHIILLLTIMSQNCRHPW